MAQLFGIARIGRDTEVRHTPGGDAVANISLAFTYGRKGEDGKKPTQWVDASLWGQRAETLAQYLVKGTLISVTLDDVHIEEYQTRDQRTGSKLVGRVSNLEFAAKAPEQGQQSAPAQTQRNPVTPARVAPAQQAAASSLADMDDDIPF